MEENNNEIQKKNYGLGITAFVLGIISFVSICYIFISIIFGVLAIGFGVASCIKEKNNLLGKAGLIIAAISLLFTVLSCIFLGVLDLDLLYIPEWYQL